MELGIQNGRKINAFDVLKHRGASYCTLRTCHYGSDTPGLWTLTDFMIPFVEDRQYQSYSTSFSKKKYAELFRERFVAASDKTGRFRMPGDVRQMWDFSFDSSGRLNPFKEASKPAVDGGMEDRAVTFRGTKLEENLDEIEAIQSNESLTHPPYIVNNNVLNNLLDNNCYENFDGTQIDSANDGRPLQFYINSAAQYGALKLNFSGTVPFPFVPDGNEYITDPETGEYVLLPGGFPEKTDLFYNDFSTKNPIYFNDDTKAILYSNDDKALLRNHTYQSIQGGSWNKYGPEHVYNAITLPRMYHWYIPEVPELAKLEDLRHNLDVIPRLVEDNMFLSMWPSFTNEKKLMTEVIGYSDKPKGTGRGLSGPLYPGGVIDARIVDAQAVISTGGSTPEQNIKVLKTTRAEYLGGYNNRARQINDPNQSSSRDMGMGHIGPGETWFNSRIARDTIHIDQRRPVTNDDNTSVTYNIVRDGVAAPDPLDSVRTSYAQKDFMSPVVTYTENDEERYEGLGTTVTFGKSHLNDGSGIEYLDRRGPWRQSRFDLNFNMRDMYVESIMRYHYTPTTPCGFNPQSIASGLLAFHEINRDDVNFTHYHGILKYNDSYLYENRYRWDGFSTVSQGKYFMTSAQASPFSNNSLPLPVSTYPPGGSEYTPVDRQRFFKQRFSHDDFWRHKYQTDASYYGLTYEHKNYATNIDYRNYFATSGPITASGRLVKFTGLTVFNKFVNQETLEIEKDAQAEADRKAKEEDDKNAAQLGGTIGGGIAVAIVCSFCTVS